MERRAFLFALGAAPIVAATPALAGWEEGVQAIFEAQPGEGARVTRTRSGFLLEVSGLRFNIGMPPTIRGPQFSGPVVAGLQFEIQMGRYRAMVEIDGPRRARVRKDSGDTVQVSVRGGQGLRALTDTPEGVSAALIGIAATGLEGSPGRSGDAVVMSGGTTMLLQFEIQ